MISFTAVLPIGSRTCCNVNKSNLSLAHVWLNDDVEEHVSEVRSARAGALDSDLTKAQHKDALGALESLKKKAQRGQLEVGDGPEFLARRIRRVGYLLELRPKFGRGKPPPRLFRLYYAEPKQVAGSLLPLALATKPNSSDDAEQNKSIDSAKGRSRLWALKKGFAT